METLPSIIFMGTPDFAVPCLNALHAAGFPVKLVVTQPDRPQGRGRKVLPPPVKIAAERLAYDLLQPCDIRDTSCVERLRTLSPDFLVVVAFGQILPASILGIPKKSAVNVHASLLPKYRGPAPIQWAILRGETETGVTTMLMDHGVDTGDMLLKTQTPINAGDTAQQLHDRLSRLGAALLVETLHELWTGKLFPRAQQNEKATYAPMLSKKDGRIDWNKSAGSLDAFIRAMTPWPGAFCFLGEKRLRIIKASPVHEEQAAPPGTVVPGFPGELRIATGSGTLSVLEIQGASGKCMGIERFLCGNPIQPGALFS